MGQLVVFLFISERTCHAATTGGNDVRPYNCPGAKGIVTEAGDGGKWLFAGNGRATGSVVVSCVNVFGADLTRFDLRGDEIVDQETVPGKGCGPGRIDRRPPGRGIRRGT